MTDLGMMYVVLGLSLIGCSGSSTDSHDGTASTTASFAGRTGTAVASPAGAGVAGSGGGSVGTSPELTHDGGGGGGDGSLATVGTPAYYGSVQFGWVGSATFQTLAHASFTNPTVAAGVSCTRQAIGACTVSTCAGADAEPAPQAGAITLSDGSKFNVSLTPSALGSYTSYSVPGIQLAGGETVTVTAAGSDVPAFTGTVTEPLVLLVTSPSAVDMGTLNWPRTQDLTFVFERGIAGVQLIVEGGSGPGKTIACVFPSEAGTATIPAAVLGVLDAGDLLQVLTAVTRRVQAGEYSVDLISYGAATNVAKTQGVDVVTE